MTSSESDYPDWICRDCAIVHKGVDFPRAGVSTYHIGKCGWCGKERVVTEPRDYGYPEWRL